jgi:hypothetical protein
MSISLICRPFLSWSHWRFSTMPLCLLFPPPPTSVASPLVRAWLLINLLCSIYHRTTSSCAPPSYTPDPSMSIPPFALDLSLWLWFDFVLFFFFPIFSFTFPSPFFFASNKARSSLFNLFIYILMLCGVFALILDIWVADVNNILTFGSKMMSFGLKVLCSHGR